MMNHVQQGTQSVIGSQALAQGVSLENTRGFPSFSVRGLFGRFSAAPSINPWFCLREGNGCTLAIYLCPPLRLIFIPLVYLFFFNFVAVTRFCACAVLWFLVWWTFFQSWLSVKKSSSIDPERPEKFIMSILKNYLVHFGSFKPHIWYFHASIVEKFEVIGEKCTSPYSLLSVFLQTDQSIVAFNVVIWLSFLSFKFLQATIYLCRIVFKR